jgi:hypothetical protein
MSKALAGNILQLIKMMLFKKNEIGYVDLQKK